jgi:acyl-CoA thioesterase-1
MFIAVLQRSKSMGAKILKIVILVLFLGSTNLVMATNNSETTLSNNSSDKVRPIILVLGDSISAGYGIELSKGWVALLQQKLLAKNYSHQVINASVSGNTSADGLKRLPNLLKHYTPNIVIIELGGNDGLRGYPIKLMKKNIQSMIDLSQKNNAEVLLAGIEIPPNYGQRYTTLFRDAFQDLATTNSNIQYEPFILEGVATKPALMQSDGIHPTAKAQPQLLNNIWDDLMPLLKKEIEKK